MKRLFIGLAAAALVTGCWQSRPPCVYEIPEGYRGWVWIEFENKDALPLQEKRGKGPGSFAFLGFTHYWAKTLSGGWTIKRKTQGKRLSRFLSGIGDWCKEHLHEPLAEQHRTLSAKLRGHYQYYGVRGNYKMLEVVYEHTRVMWKKWLRRRNSMNRMSWERFAEQVEQTLALPLPRIVHPF